jgi:5-methylcytosine-specific restriction endonuclease McrA
VRIVNPKEIEYVRYKRDGVCLWGLIKRDGCSGGLDVHHIDTRGSGGDDVRENLITLCRKHHNQAGAHRITPDELRTVLTKWYGYKY